MSRILALLLTCLCLPFTLLAQPAANPKPPVLKRNPISEIIKWNELLPAINKPPQLTVKKTARSNGKASNQLKTFGTTCLDTSKRLLLREDTAWVSNDPISKTADNNILIPGFHYIKSTFYTVPHLMKCSSSGKILWSKSYYNPAINSISYFNGYFAKELKNGDIIYIGAMAIRMPVNGREELSIMRLNATGNLKWGKTFKCKLWSDTTSGTQFVVDVKEDSNDNLYVAGSQGNYGNHTQNFVFKLDKNGTQLWDRNYLGYGGVYGIALLNNEILLSGGYSSGNYNNTYFARINALNGDTISTKGFTPDYYGQFDSHRSFMSNARMMLMDDGRIAIYGTAFSDLDTYNPQDTIRHSNVAYFTPQLDFINGISVSSKYHTNYNNTVISPDPYGKRISYTRTYYISGYKSDVIYGTILNNQVIKERFYEQRNRSNAWTSNFLHFSGNEDVITQYYGDSINNLTGIEFIRLHESDTAGYCTGIDTSLTFVEPFNLRPAYVYLPVVDSSGFVETFRPIPGGQSTQMVKETGCEQVSFCDSLSIHTLTNTICANTPVIITATRNKECGAGINWDFGTTNQAFEKINDTTIRTVFKQPWQGKIYGRISGCTDLTDSLTITVLPALGPVSLGPDTSICPGNTFTIHAAPGYKKYLWYDGTTDSTLTVSAPGTYAVAVTSACNNVFTDTIVIKQAAAIPFSVGPDTTKCNGDSVALTAPASFIAYSWSPAYNISGTTTASVKVYPATDTIYTIKAEKTPGCFAFDTVRVKVNFSSAIHLGKDTTICDNSNITLKAGNSFTYYVWSTGSTTPTITTQNAGVYSVAATATNNCISTDTISISVKTTPVFSLGSDTLVCAGQQHLMQPAVIGDFAWQDGSVGKQQTITTAGLYWLTVSNGICAQTDSIHIGIKPIPVVSLPADTTICNTATLQLNVTQSGASYLWNDGTVVSTKAINGSGTYSVTVTKAGCNQSDTIKVVKLQSPLFSLGRDTSICNGDIYHLSASAGNWSYRWKDNSTSNAINVNQAGIYFVTGTNYCGTLSDTIKISTVQCNCSLDVANSFSPNNDGINDLFNPDLLCTPILYNLSIYNRYGSLVFETHRYGKGWNGTYNGSKMPVGTYYYLLQVKGESEPVARRKSGSVTLLR